MASIDPTVRLAETRSFIDLLQQEISTLESLMSQYTEAYSQNSQSGSGTTAATDRYALTTQQAAAGQSNAGTIVSDYQAYLQDRHLFSPTEQRDVLRGLAYDAGITHDQVKAWTEFSAKSQSVAATRQAITVLKASLGAARQEESYWNSEQQEQQKMQKSSNEIAKL